MDRFDRIFELNRILQAARQPVSRQRLQEALECSRATVGRIIEDMRLYLNAPIVYDPDLNGYRYDQSEGMYELPGLWFNASELHALISVQQLLTQVQPGLLDPLLKPLNKRIAGLLDLQRAGSDGLAPRIRVVQAAGREGGESFSIVAGALAQRRQLRLCYFNRGDASRGERTVSPQRLTYYRDNWYLDAWCHLREGLRTFALDAIEAARALGADALDLPEAELEAHYAASYGIFAGAPDRVAVLRFAARRALWVSKERWHRDQLGFTLADGRYELQVPYSNTPELVMDILKYGPDVEVVAPEGLRTEVIERLSTALGQYEGMSPRPEGAGLHE